MKTQMQCLHFNTPGQHLMSAHAKVLHGYQRLHAVKLRHLLSTCGFCIDASVTGSGKTITATHVAKQFVTDGTFDQVLVICPNATKSKWECELIGVGFSPYSDAAGTVDEEARGPASLVIAYSELLRTSKRSAWMRYDKDKVAMRSTHDLDKAFSEKPKFKCELGSGLTEYVDMGRTMLVVDESHRVKNEGAQVSQAVSKIQSAIRLRHGCTLLMSATFMDNITQLPRLVKLLSDMSEGTGEGAVRECRKRASGHASRMKECKQDSGDVKEAEMKRLLRIGVAVRKSWDVICSTSCEDGDTVSLRMPDNWSAKSLMEAALGVAFAKEAKRKISADYKWIHTMKQHIYNCDQDTGTYYQRMPHAEMASMVMDMPEGCDGGEFYTFVIDAVMCPVTLLVADRSCCHYRDAIETVRKVVLNVLPRTIVKMCPAHVPTPVVTTVQLHLQETRAQAISVEPRKFVFDYHVESDSAHLLARSWIALQSFVSLTGGDTAPLCGPPPSCAVVTNDSAYLNELVASGEWRLGEMLPVVIWQRAVHVLRLMLDRGHNQLLPEYESAKCAYDMCAYALRIRKESRVDGKPDKVLALKKQHILVSIENAKAPALAGAACAVARRGDCKVVAMFNYLESLQAFATRVRAEFPHGVQVITGDVDPEERSSIMCRFEDNASDVCVLACTIGTMREGVDLHDTGRNGIKPRVMFVMSCPSAIAMTQAAGRTMRAGSVSSTAVFIVWGQCQGTDRYERTLMSRLGSKAGVMAVAGSREGLEILAPHESRTAVTDVDRIMRVCDVLIQGECKDVELARDTTCMGDGGGDTGGDTGGDQPSGGGVQLGLMPTWASVQRALEHCQDGGHDTLADFSERKRTRKMTTTSTNTSTNTSSSIRSTRSIGRSKGERRDDMNVGSDEVAQPQGVALQPRHIVRNVLRCGE